MVVDVVVVLLLAGGFLLGFFRGAIRQLLALGSWVMAFLLAANLSGPVGRWLATQTAYPTDYSMMLTFGALLAVLLGASATYFQVSGATVTLTRHVLLDNLLGAALGVLFVVVTFASVLVVLDTFYAVAETSAREQIDILQDIYLASRESVISEALRETLIPLIGQIAGRIVPDHVRTVMA